MRGIGIQGFVGAVEGCLEKLGAELEKVGADLMAGGGEVGEGVDVEVSSYLGDYAGWKGDVSILLSIIICSIIELY